jgi:hypothetical protein
MVHTFSPPSKRLQRIPIVVSTLALALSLTLGGCASVPPPDSAMNQAQALIQAARDAGAADYDPVDLGFAQDKFQQAQMAMSNRKYALASDLADEARADATLAQTKAQLGAARAQIQAKQNDNDQQRAQNQEAQAESEQHAAQEKAQLAAQQAPTAQQADPDAPAGSASSALPPQAPTQQDLPSPSSSVLGAPVPQGQGFQTMPDVNQQQPAPAQSTQGGQP